MAPGSHLRLSLEAFPGYCREAVGLSLIHICGAQHNGAAAILAAHGGRVDSFLLFLVFHGPFTSVRI